MKTYFSFGAVLVLGVSALAAKPDFTPELLKKGEAKFGEICKTCHEADGSASGPMGRALKARNLTDKKEYKGGASVEKIFDTVTNGFKLNGKPTAMVGYPSMSEEERWAVAYYVVTTIQKNNGSAAGKTAQKKKK